MVFLKSAFQARHQGHKGQNSAFTPVVGGHHEKNIFYADDDHQGPQHHGNDPEDVALCQ